MRNQTPHSIDDFYWLVEEQLPGRLREKVTFTVISDAYHLRARVLFVSKDNANIKHECELEQIRKYDTKSLALKIPDVDIAHLCAFFM